jgi:hypothetical protein
MQPSRLPKTTAGRATPTAAPPTVRRRRSRSHRTTCCRTRCSASRRSAKRRKNSRRRRARLGLVRHGPRCTAPAARRAAAYRRYRLPNGRDCPPLLTHATTAMIEARPSEDGVEVTHGACKTRPPQPAVASLAQPKNDRAPERDIWGLIVLRFLLAIIVGLVLAGHANASCVCRCVDGQMQPLCTSAIDLRPICPMGACAMASPSIAPLQPMWLPPLGTSRVAA